MKHPDNLSGRELGLYCIELARKAKDGELDTSHRGKYIGSFKCDCQHCGIPIIAEQYENFVSGTYCESCDQKILQEIYDHEVELLNSGYYG